MDLVNNYQFAIKILKNLFVPHLYIQIKILYIEMKLSVLLIISVVSIFAIYSASPSAFGYGGPPENNSANNYTVKISTNQESYLLGESVIFTGSVNKYDENRSLRITIFDSSKNLISTKKPLWIHTVNSLTLLN